MSELHDQKLSEGDEYAVRAHMEQCVDCTRRFSDICRLSQLAAELPEIPPPKSLWPAIEGSLAVRDQSRITKAQWSRSRFSRAAMLAAALLAIGSTSLLIYRFGIVGDDPHGAVHFAKYLDEFRLNPEHAQQGLVAKYQGQYVDSNEAARQGRFPPITPANLPRGLTRDNLCVLKMPCCTCVQSIFKDDASRMLVVFEHVADEPEWFADRPTITAQCHGTPTNLVQLDGNLAATWKTQGRFVTVVGAHDLEEVSQLVASLGTAESPAGPLESTTQ